MLSGRRSLFSYARLGLARRVAPFTQAEQFLFSPSDLDLAKAAQYRVTVRCLDMPETSEDYCLNPPRHAALARFLETPEIEDRTETIARLFALPEIIDFPTEIGTPKREGKAYSDAPRDTQIDLFDDSNAAQDKACAHGLKKEWCSICNEEREAAKRSIPRRMDLFDMIFPVLQPPLGANFDNTVVFAIGQDLYPFQRTGVQFLASNERALLGDEMGLGKSIQTIVALKFLFRTGKIRRCLIVAPKSVLMDWERKLWDWAPELNRVIRVAGNRQTRTVLWSSEAFIYVVTYETLARDLAASLGRDEHDLLSFETESEPSGDIARRDFDVVVLDEVQKIKNATTDNSRAVRLLHAQRRWALSGTPLVNSIDDLCSIFGYLVPGRIRSSEPVAIIKEKIRPYLLRRTKVDALPELPEKVFEEKWLDLLPTQRDAYDKAEHDGVVKLNELGAQITVTHVLQLITHLYMAT